jgi:hypothetical protein
LAHLGAKKQPDRSPISRRDRSPSFAISDEQSYAIEEA